RATGRPISFHCSMPRRKTLDLRETERAQGPRSRCRTLIGPADEYDRLFFKSGKLGQSASNFGDGNIAGGRDVAERSNELIGSAHVDHRYGFTVVEPALERVGFDPCERSAAQAPDQPR